MSQVTRANSKLKFETGDVPTQADFEDLHDSVVWYDETIGNPKVYIAKVSGNGTSAPTVTVIKNTLGGTVVWTRTGLSTYQANLSGAFTEGKTFLSSAPGENRNGFLSHIHADVNRVSFINGSAQDDQIISNFVRIEVYT